MDREVGITRRRLLEVGAASAATLALGSRLARGSRPGRVLVVGAGLAGLSAAYELKRAGFDVLVIEARDRVGGRVHTLRRPFLGGQHGEAGGEYIDTGHRTMLGYVDRFGLDLEDVRLGSDEFDGAVYLRGRRRRYSGYVTPAIEREMDRYYARSEALGQRVRLSDPVGSAGDLDRRSLGDLLDELRLSPAARLVIEQDEIDDYLVAPSKLSLLFHAYLYRVTDEQSDSGVEAYRIRGGNDRLPRAFARRLGSSLITNAPATAIRDTGGGVSVVSARGTYEGDWCVLAAPLPTLRNVSFDPQPPEQLRAAIAELQYGVGVKTLIQYGSRIWRRQGFDGDMLTDLAIRSGWEATDRQPGRRGILIAYTAGPAGESASDLADGARTDQATSDLERVYPGSRERRLRTATAAWRNEPFSRGGYTAYAPGQMTRFWSALRRPYGRIYLAGEHTDAFTGYMEGAVRSGRRVAAAIRDQR